MKKTISFFVSGVPKGQPRPRAFARNGKVRVYDPGTAEGWKSAIAIAAEPHRPAQPIEGPIICSIDFALPRPKRLMRKCDPDGPLPHTGKPDRDNLDKAVLDALTTLGFWRDDAQVYIGTIIKQIASKTGRPGAFITIDWETPNERISGATG